MRRWHGATALLIALGTGLVLAGVHTAAAQVPAHGVIATTTDGVVLASDPALVPGERVVLVASGFAREAETSVRVPGPADVPVRADSSGHARLVYVVPALDPGTFEVVFVGPPGSAPATSSAAPTSSAPSSFPSGGGNVVVTVPLLDVFTFHVDPPVSGSSSGSGIEGVHASRGAAAGGSVGSGLAGTGTDAAALLTVGAFFVATGLGIELLARRRRRVSGPDERPAV